MSKSAPTPPLSIDPDEEQPVTAPPAPPRPAAVAPLAQPETLFVFDPSASAEYIGDPDKLNTWRRHSILLQDARGNQVEKVYAFRHGAPTEMPAAHAMKFLKAEGFIVQAKGGRTIRPVRDPLADVGAPGPQLEADECIANLGELTLPALLKRAGIMPGGEQFAGNSQRDDVVAFIVNARREKAARNAAAVSRRPGAAMDENSDPALSDMADPEAFERAFGDTSQE